MKNKKQPKASPCDLLRMRSRGMRAVVLPFSPVVRILRTRRDSRLLGAAIAEVLWPGDLVILSGSLGAGKTFVTRAIAKALGVTTRVTSPTFSLLHEHETSTGTFAHADLYRLRSFQAPASSPDTLDEPDAALAAEVDRLGLRDLRARGAIVVVEWGEWAGAALGGDPDLVVQLCVTVGVTGPSERKALLSGPRAGGIL